MNNLLSVISDVVDLEYLKVYHAKNFEDKESAAEFCLSESISPTPIFDIECYHECNPDVRNYDISPIEHYFSFGYKEDRVFNYAVDAAYYRSCHGLDLNTNIIQHYKVNRPEGASLSPIFDDYYYKSSYEISYDTVFEDYLLSENKNPSPYVNEVYYRNSKVIVEPALRYMGRLKEYTYTSPIVEKINLSNISKNQQPEIECSFLFDQHWYIAQNPGVEALGALRHYTLFGEKEGRNPHSLINCTVLKKTINKISTDNSHLEAMAKFMDVALKEEAYSFDSTKISVVILNWNKALMTVQCVLTALMNANSKKSVEIIVVDNGSNDSDFSQLFKLNKISNLKIIRNKTNRFYGEANNIGVEASSGKYILLLNNDAFLSPNWDQLLLSPILEQEADATGPKFVFPDGRLQEAGGQINPCGQNIQIGKGLSSSEAAFNVNRYVSHISAACFMLSKEDYLSIGGFDQRYEPAYYEDADLTAKLSHFSKRIMYLPECEVIHIENATSKDPNIGFDFGSLISTNRTKFVQRWSKELLNIEKTNIPLYSKAITAPTSNDVGKKIAVVYSPYNLTPGGGERYILSAAITFSAAGYDTYFATPERYSKVRILNVGNELGIDTSNITPISEDDLGSLNVDVSFVMSNELSPSKRVFAKYNIYHCQFPFPMSDWHIANCVYNVKDYDVVVVNSEFTKTHYELQAQKLGVEIPNVEIITPPVSVNSDYVAKDYGDTINIANVGRFIKGGHCKNQLILLESFKELSEASNMNYKLNLIGSLSSSSEDREYYSDIVKYIETYELNVSIYINASVAVIEDVLQRSLFYWHGTGLDKDVTIEPWVFEHFGITPVEAMSFGAIPVVACHGGPAETVIDSLPEYSDYLLCNSKVDYCINTQKLMLLSQAELKSIADNCQEKSLNYSEDLFCKKINYLLDHKQDS